MNNRIINNKRKIAELENIISAEVPQSNEQQSLGNIEIIDNHIYFYCDVNTKNILQLNKAIITLNKTLAV